MAREKILKGIAVSHGIGRGKAYIYEPGEVEILQTPILPIYLEKEIARFEEAIEKTQKELNNIKKRINQEIGEDFAQFLDAQVMMLNDKEIIERVKKEILKQKMNAGYIYNQVIKEYAQRLGASKNQYFRERVADIWDVGIRVLRNLFGLTHASIVEVPEGSILIARDISPSDAALIDPKNIKGIATEVGGRTTHTAITARALQIPAVLGVKRLLSCIEDDEKIIIDGDRGIVIKNPSPGRIRFYDEVQKKKLKLSKALSPYCELPSQTRDGKYIDISANIEFYAEYNYAKKYGAAGIGLFRTEFLYLARRGNPAEEEQFRVYNALAKSMKPQPVIIRTFDLGGDKIFSDYQEANPFLGWRAIRVCLDKPEFFKTQLRAILRASVNHNIKIMYPMIATYEEIKRANLIFEQVRKDLIKQKIDFDHQIQVGIMIETPSAALLSPQLVSQVDFFSIGSNDLTQYTLAVDRGNEKVNRLFDHYHPAVLRLINNVIHAGHEGHIWVGLCGELASDPLILPFLVGAGIDELSMAPMAIPKIKMVLRSLTVSKCEKIAHEVLKFRTALEVKKFLRRAIHKNFPGIEEVL